MEPSPAAEFDSIFRDSFPTIVRAAWLVVGDWETARELTQDAFVEALKRWKRIRTYDQPGAWVRRVAINKAINAKRRRVTPLAAPVDAPAADQADLDLRAALDELTTPQRAAVVLHHLWDLPVDEVATLMDCAPGTVKSHLSRGRARLAVALGDAPGDDELEVADEPR